MSRVTRGYTFGATETVTNAKLHSLVDDAIVGDISNSDVATDASIDGSKINIDTTGNVLVTGTQTITGAKTFTSTTAMAGVSATGLTVNGDATITGALTIPSISLTAQVTGILPVANGGTGKTSLTDIGLPSQTSNSGKFLTTNGSVSSWASVGSPYTDGTITETYLSDYVSNNVSSLTLAVQFSPIIRSGSIRVNWSTSTSGGSTALSRVYINNSPVDVQKSGGSNSTYVQHYSVVSVSAGDVVSIWATTDQGSSNAYKLVNAYLSCSNPTNVTPNTTVPQIFSGNGVPNPVLGNIGAIYLRTDGSAGTTLYKKVSDTSWSAS